MNPRLHIAIVLITGCTVLAAAWLLGKWAFSAGERPATLAAVEARKVPAIPSSASHRAAESRQIVALPAISESIASSAPADPLQQLLEALQAEANDPNAVANEMVLTFPNKAARAAFVSRLGSHGLQLLGTIEALNAVRVGYKDLAGLRDLIAETGGQARAESNQWMQVPRTPNVDPNNQGGTTPFQRGQEMMSAIAADGDRSQWGQAVKVAVLDTGIMAHPTFGKDQVTHLDLVNDGQTFHSHGTSVASMIAGQNPQAPGVAPATEILDIRVANAEGYTVSSVLSQGIIEAVDRGAKVLNISLGGHGDSELLRAALDYAAAKGAVVVAAAGNEGYDQLSIPAAYENVLSVGSVDAGGKQASFSNSGQGLDLVAPGVGVVSAWETDKVAIASGTSHSTGLVSGAVAAYLSWGVSQKEVSALLKKHARSTGAPANQVGAGILTVQPAAVKR